jgi:predicted metal-binding protein
LGKTIQALNDDYLFSADYRTHVNERSGLKCGYDCPHYEEHLEACPLLFWEIKETKIIGLKQLIHLLKDESIRSCFGAD